jgi:hypothetical protein
VVGAIAKIGSLISAVVRLAAGDVSLVLASGKLRRVGKEESEIRVELCLERNGQVLGDWVCHVDAVSLLTTSHPLIEPSLHHNTIHRISTLRYPIRATVSVTLRM